MKLFKSLLIPYIILIMQIKKLCMKEPC